MRRLEPLGNSQLAVCVPSAFTGEAHRSRSERYTHLPTTAVIEALATVGFHPYEARESFTSDLGRRGFTKHLIRFRTEEMAKAVGDVVPEVITINAHDGSAAYRFLAGMWRLVCENGLMVAQSVLAELRVTHKGDVVAASVEATLKIAGELRPVMERVRAWQGTELSGRRQVAFAERARALRFGEESRLEPAVILRPRRTVDEGSDLWRTFNRVQENLMVGGLAVAHQTTDGRTIHGHTRRITSIDADVKFNRGLWELAEEFSGRAA